MLIEYLFYQYSKCYIYIYRDSVQSYEDHTLKKYIYDTTLDSVHSALADFPTNDIYLRSLLQLQLYKPGGYHGLKAYFRDLSLRVFWDTGPSCLERFYEVITEINRANMDLLGSDIAVIRRSEENDQFRSNSLLNEEVSQYNCD